MPDVPAKPLATAAPDESLAAELEALNAILSAVEQERWPDAAAALDAFRSRFSKPVLEIEASVLEVRVRCGEQRTDEARDLSSKLRSRFPRNPSVQRLNPEDPCQKR